MSKFQFFKTKYLVELKQRNRPDISNPITNQDLEEFLRCPQLWRKDCLDVSSLEAESLRWWMQDIYNEMGILCEVPLPSVLTPKQRQVLDEFNFRLFYIPAISEEDYPKEFILPDWKKRLESCVVKRKELPGCWVAVEFSSNTNWTEFNPEDKLLTALKLPTRFKQSCVNLNEKKGIFSRLARLLSFSKKKIRLPTAKEWNFLGNLFLWLNANRREKLPDFNSFEFWERTSDHYDEENCIIVGFNMFGGLASVASVPCGHKGCGISFRILVEL